MTFKERRWGFPKIRGVLLGVPIIRIIVFEVYMGGSPCFGKLLGSMKDVELPGQCSGSGV